MNDSNARTTRIRSDTRSYIEEAGNVTGKRETNFACNIAADYSRNNGNARTYEVCNRNALYFYTERSSI
jgi:hypothetical protein